MSLSRLCLFLLGNHLENGASISILYHLVNFQSLNIILSDCFVKCFLFDSFLLQINHYLEDKKIELDVKFVWLTFTDNMFGLVVFMVKHLYLNQLIQFISSY